MAINAPRPTSPHLTIYKLPLTAFISITHRATGILLSAGLILFVLIISALAMGEAAYLTLQAVLQFWLIKLSYWGFVFALCFHACHGVRHLFWDAGYSFDRETLTRYAQAELITACVLTLVILIAV